MLQAVADTHTLIWHLSGDDLISLVARSRFERAAETGGRIGVSAISLVEIIYLEEKGRIHAEALKRLDDVLGETQSILLELPVNRLIAMSVLDVARAQIPELPDRIIAATAQLYGVPLITRDRRIVSSGISTIW
jgi:PIN domain nuclease of toxin-antitoxin system